MAPPKPWFRYYNDTTTDIKIRRIASRLGYERIFVLGIWTAVMTLANKSPVPGSLLIAHDIPVTNEEIADEAGTSNLDLTEAILAQFESLDMTYRDEDGVITLVHWDERQFESDSSTERVKRFREKRRQPTPPPPAPTTQPDRNASGNGDETFQCNNMKPPRAEQSRADTEQSIADTEQSIAEAEEEEPAAAAAAGSFMITAPEAERIYVEVTGMPSIPGGREEQGLTIQAICNLAPRYGPGLAAYLKPFFQAQQLCKTRDNRPYSRTAHFWLQEWAISGILPEYARAQLLLRKPNSLPPELRAYLLKAPAADQDQPKSLPNGRSQASYEQAVSLGLIKPKGEQA